MTLPAATVRPPAAVSWGEARKRSVIRSFTLRTEPLDEASAWVERHRDEWNERFDLLDERLRELKGQTDA